MKTCLVLIDIQNDYFPKGNMELEGALSASLRAKEALHFFRKKDLPVVHIQHISVRPGASFFLPDTDGAAIHENVRPLPNETVFQKHFPNSFRDTPLLRHLKDNQIGRLAIVGMMTSMCVDATVRAAFDYGFENIILHDAMATKTLAFNGEFIPARHVHGSFLAALGSVYGVVKSVEDFLLECEATTSPERR